MRLLIGTREGLFLLRGTSGWREVRCSRPLLTRRAVGPLLRLPAGGALAAVGGALHRSADGMRWRRLGVLPASLRFWSLAAGGEALYAGTEPAALLRSRDGGRSWQEMAGLRGHPTASEWWGPWQQPLTQAVVADPRHPSRLHVAISVAGVFRGEFDAEDQRWKPVNVGIPPLYPRGAEHSAVHRDVQNLALVPPHLTSPDAPTVLLASTAHGLYRRQADDDEWALVSGNWASRGVRALAVARSAGAIYAVPLGGAFGGRTEGQRQVWRSTDGGRVWRPLPALLPPEATGLVHRDALAVCEPAADAPLSLYLGTRDGIVLWCDDDGGDTWHPLAQGLPSIHSLLPLPDEGSGRDRLGLRWPFGWG